MEKEKCNLISNLIFSIKEIFKLDKIYLFEQLLITIFNAITTFLYPYIIMVVVRGIEEKLDITSVLIEACIVVIVCLGIEILEIFLRNDVFKYRQNKLNYIMTKKLYQYSLSVDYEKLEDPDMQDALEKAGKAVSYGLIFDLVNCTFNVLSSFIVIIIASSIIMYVNIWLVGLIIVLSVLKLLLENYDRKKEKTDFLNKIPGVWRKITYANSISRNLSIGKDLRIYEMNKFIEKERKIAVDEYLKCKKKDYQRKTWINSLLHILKAIDEILLYGFMIYEVINNDMTIATFTFMIASVRELVNAINRIISDAGYTINASYQINDYRYFMGLDIVSSGIYTDLEAETVEVEFKNVYYQYLEQEGYALENVSFKINKNEKIALVGFNGAGKSTMVKLLCGLYKPTKGEILINGVDITKISRSSLQDLIAPIFQQTMHYGVEILENVSMLPHEETDCAKIDYLFDLLDLKDKINILELKEKTMLTRDFDEKGIELSGGESQKLSIARAVYKNAPFIILDEPTASLDAMAEALLYEKLNEITANASAIFISHRLSSTKFCDRVFVLDEGKLVEVGTHEELMKEESLYKKLFSMQAQYYQEGI